MDKKNHKEKKFLTSPNHICGMCRARGHRINDCIYRAETVYERMLLMEEELEYKKNLSEKGGREDIRKNDNKKIQRMCVLSKEALINKYRDAFYSPGEEIKFCREEKCKIITKKGEKVVKRGAIVPQALRRATEDYIRDLGDKKIIRRSESEWRNPIRALQKPNGSIRLVSNFMALNDLCEKDPYELREIKDVINITQGKEFIL